MRKPTTRALAVAAALLLACAARGRAADAGDAPAKLSLEQRYPPGAYEMNVRMDSEQKILQAGSPTADVAFTQQYDIALAIAEPGADGSRDMTFAFRRIRVENRSGGGAHAYDSDGDPAGNSPKLAAAFKPLLGYEVAFRVTPTNEVTVVRGLQPLWDGVVAKDPDMAEVAAEMRQKLGDEVLRQLVTMPSRVLPDGPVAKGDTWEKRSQVPVPFVGLVDLEQTCRLAQVTGGAGDGTARVENEGRLAKADAGQASFEGVIVRFKSIDFRLQGFTRFDLALGMAVEQEMTQQGTVKVEIVPPEGEAQPGESKQKIRTTMTLRRTDAP